MATDKVKFYITTTNEGTMTEAEAVALDAHWDAKLKNETGTLKGLMRHLDDAWPEAMPPENIRVRFTVGTEAYVVGHIVLSAEEDGEVILVELKKEDI
jgi:hypothetical protein